MNKKDLIRRTAEAAHMDRKEVAVVCETMLQTIADTLQAGEKVHLVGFGAFEAKARAGHTGLNPRTKQPITIEAHKAPSFRASKQLKDYLNKT